ncbi:MAG: tripartite tricarboxylate transporter permease [Nanoarchaeota archaeon]|nr:tripartite tricarboxylate transporter permease [Nanoarchaeota archaeon]
MLLQITLFFILGTIAGILTGLSPGIHINIVGAALVSLSAAVFSSILPLYLVVFIVAMSITHSFVDFIPSIFLGAPNEDTALSVLPGHELLNEGKGYEAVMLSNYGCLIAIFLLIFLSIPLSFIIPITYPYLTKAMAFILIIFSINLIFIEKNKFSALLVFILTGILGFIILNLNESLLAQPLLPLLSGLFGSSSLLLSIKQKTKIPQQEINNKFKIPLKAPLLGSIIASPLCGFLPGLGSGQAAILGNQIAKTDKRGFIVLIGITNTLVMGFSFISLYLIQKARTGSAVSIQQLIGTISYKMLMLILIICLFSGIISFFITKFLAEIFAGKIDKINYSILSIFVLIIIFIVVFIFSGFFGLIILILSTLTGIYCISLGVKRTNMMGCLLIPTILYYLGQQIF